MSDNGRYAGDNEHPGAQASADAAPLTRRQLREREAAAAAANPAAAAPDPFASSVLHTEPLLPRVEVVSPRSAQLVVTPSEVSRSDAASELAGMFAVTPGLASSLAPTLGRAQTTHQAPPALPAWSGAPASLVPPVPQAPYPVRGRGASRAGKSRTEQSGTGQSGAGLTADNMAKSPAGKMSVPAVFSMPRVSIKAPSRKVIASKLFSTGALIFAAALLVGTTVPANAFMSVDDSQMAVANASFSEDNGQSLNVSNDISGVGAARDSFTVTSYAEMLRQKYGNVSYNYTVTNGAVRWPFPFAVPISSGFGDRVAPCRSCSSQHMGLDFTPGEGSPIYAIADGVVSHAEISRWGYGNWVTIDHVINGQKVQTLYAHMQMNSSALLVGDTIKVGDFIGLVGSTGASTGAHLHFEVRLDEVQVDPFAWLRANATN